MMGVFLRHHAQHFPEFGGELRGEDLQQFVWATAVANINDINVSPINEWGDQATNEDGCIRIGDYKISSWPTTLVEVSNIEMNTPTDLQREYYNSPPTAEATSIAFLSPRHCFVVADTASRFTLWVVRPYPCCPSVSLGVLQCKTSSVSVRGDEYDVAKFTA